MMDAHTLYEEAREVAARLAREAGQIVRYYAGRVTVREKGYNELVTQADEEVQRFLIEQIHRRFPEHAILAEENLSDVQDGREGASFRWIIDPIDGTTNFTHGVPPYGISLALQHEGRTVVGVVYDVPHDELFTAVRGGGLYVNGVRARVSQTETLREALITTGFPYREVVHLEEYLEALGRVIRATRGVRRPGAASVDLAWVACGRFDGFFETGLSPWDVAAGILLVEEGGGRVTDFHGRSDPIFARQMLATNGRIHEALCELVAPLHHVYA
ncbi:inositol monophosphatase [Rhodothermus marinus SG0.5JP17-172]|uniref:inositol monophosphatase family protein n=2 Tax=Rhodothermus marinus TaxID=29549 RepID=UPI000223D809|nr:inositol monophosphatase family protein [Rhodothermus marinus]AEN72329.1 inositol monophosphatase [Rhodothermus marinus SG0.5JP17-172]